MSEKNHKGYYNKRPRENATGSSYQTEAKKSNMADITTNDASNAIKEASPRVPSNINRNKHKKNGNNISSGNNSNKNFRNDRDKRDNKDNRDNKNKKRNEFSGGNVNADNRMGASTELNGRRKFEQSGKFKGEYPKDFHKSNFSKKLEKTEKIESIKTIESAEMQETVNIQPQALTESISEDNSEKVEIVGVRYRPVGKIYFFAPNNMTYEMNDKVIVETERGIELGYVVIKNRHVDISKIVQPLKMIHRKATEEDIERVQKNKKLAAQAMAVAEEKVKEHGLKLKLIEAKYTFDNSKLLYYFTAENRIDFRELVKDLAAIFRIRIELRQIGIRDQTKILGGLSICGRPFCCNSFLQDFEQVTIKMAKEQNISINSAKISGACGRLMCCLRYEHETYESLYKDTPRVNSIVETAAGETGTVVECNVLSGMCKVRINSGTENLNVVKPYPKKELKVIGFVRGAQENGE